MTYLPPPHPGAAVRIGDAERDAAISALADHYAAGRLTKDEYDERADRVNAARFDDDIAPVFADLPSAAPARGVARPVTSRTRRRALAAPLMRFAPVLLVGFIAVVATAVGLISPWLLLAAFWFACAGLGCGNKGQHYHHYHHRRAWARTRQPSQRA